MPWSDDVLQVGGRRVGYRRSGADTRPALLYLHGAPSSRAELGDYEPGLLEEQGICAVAVDRPGYGATDPLDDLDLLARTRDAVAVAGHLGMTRFAVQGTSGGGPYALACAALMPDQVQAVILTSAGGRISERGRIRRHAGKRRRRLAADLARPRGVPGPGSRRPRPRFARGPGGGPARHDPRLARRRARMAREAQRGRGREHDGGDAAGRGRLVGRWPGLRPAVAVRCR